MSDKQFSTAAWNALVEQTFEQVKTLGKLKGGEYSGDDDRLENFRRNAIAEGVPMQTIWGVYAAKHWDALAQYRKDIVAGKQRTRLEGLQGRCDDLIVYLMLLKAMLTEAGVK